jgi:hypothetical protein
MILAVVASGIFCQSDNNALNLNSREVVYEQSI